MKIQDNSGQFRLTIPKGIAKMKGWKQGTEIVIVMNEEGDIILKEVRRQR
jgi:bifunctional DNA-binding transcriptional regulator/antitoxin component of YhaV-PrlF toxin-antitoxin module